MIGMQLALALLLALATACSSGGEGPPGYTDPDPDSDAATTEDDPIGLAGAAGGADDPDAGDDSGMPSAGAGGLGGGGAGSMNEGGASGMSSGMGAGEGGAGGGGSGAGGMTGGVGGGPAPECIRNADCDDGNDCTIDSCAGDECKRLDAATAIACADGAFVGTCTPGTGECDFACGEIEGSCCAGDVCGSGLYCREHPIGDTCQPCGGAEELCCGGATCDGDLFCGQRYVGGPAEVNDYCYQCGSAGQPCCNDTPPGGALTLTCDDGLTCAITSSGGMTGTECR
jgi:hypothetical protein